ncbi:ankyrin [Westerdykella ornata]|uniref:Ankyrin n=1 Tax=Westerdykella ornata TaxID=318751 RepID=A0A6A6JG98_WESOR|nr:ankyrin [Westerdykella ornata]KAF2275571.1 ankyrin [Westerdykella ornata]
MHDTPDAAFFDDLFGNNSAYALHLAASHGDVPQIHRLVDTGKDIDEIHVARGKFSGFGTALHVAVWRNQPTALAALLERGANMDILDEGCTNIRMEDTPIRLAVRLGRRDMAKTLWDLGAHRQKYPDDYSPRVIESGTLLEVAAFEGQADMVSDLLSWTSEWTQDQKSHALSLACAAFHLDVARVLLEAFQFDQAELEEVAAYTATCEHAPNQPCSSRDEKFAFLRREAKRQADVIATLLDAHRRLGDPRAHQALLDRLLPVTAATPFRIDTLRLLLQGGAYPNSRSESDGMTALQMALTIRRDVGTFNEEGVKELLDSGASVDVLDEAGKSKIEVWRKKKTEGVWE